MKRPAILFVTGIFPPDHGGPASYVPAIASALAQRHPIRGIITLSDSENLDDSAYPFPVVRILRGQNRFARVIRTIAAIRESARDADVVYLNGLVLEGIIACKLIGRKKVAIKVVGDLIWERARNAGVTRDSIDDFQKKSSYGLKWQFLKRLQGWYTGLADVVVTPSCYLAGVVSGWGVASGKIRVVYNSLLDLPRSNAEISEKSVDCITVARLVPWKGISELIRIAGRNRFTLNIVGDGPERSRLEKQVADEGLGELVSFRGHVPKEQVSEEIARARVFILNSTYEGLPHIVLEAKGMGMPVIATAVGGTAETITDGVDGVLVQPGDSEALAERIRFLLNHPDERERLGLAARRDVMERFSFVAMLSETEKVLDELCSKAKG